MKRLAKVLIVLIVIILTFLLVYYHYYGSIFDFKPGASGETTGNTPFDIVLHPKSENVYGPYYVEYVIDGDTFITKIDGEEKKIRLIGVDTPESVNEVNPEKNCEEGKIASSYTKNLLLNVDVWLEYDVKTEDDYGRTLAYVYLDSEGKDMLQIRLLKDGMANTMSIAPNYKYSIKFAYEASQAEKNKRGFWKSGFWTNTALNPAQN